MLFTRIPGCFLLAFLAVAPAAGAWRAGVARVDITPREPIWMAGYAVRTHPSEGVRQHLFAKALAIEDEKGARVVLVTLDLAHIKRATSDAIAARVEKTSGLARGQIVFNVSHTHSGPLIGNEFNPAYPVDAANQAVIDRYTCRLEDQTVDVIVRAVNDLSPAALSFEQGLAGVAVNRRRVGHREYPGPVDPDVPVLAVRAQDGHLRAIAFGYACHNTVLNDYQINGDWAGYAQEKLETEYPGAIALYVQGCGADANPLPRRSVALAMHYGDIVAAAVSDVLQNEMKPVAGPLRVSYATVDLPFQQLGRKYYETRLNDPNPIYRRHAQGMLAILDRDGHLPDHHSYPITVWRFGADLTFLALGGEVVADYALRFKRQYGPDNLWVAGYSNDVFAYIPSLRVLREGGYEGGDSMPAYGLPARFQPAVEEIIAAKVDELMKAGR